MIFAVLALSPDQSLLVKNSGNLSSYMEREKEEERNGEEETT